MTNISNHNIDPVRPHQPPLLPGPGSGEIEGIFVIKNDGAFREELEVQFDTLNGFKFSGTITPQEAKFNIFRDCLGFRDFSNFDGARIGYKGAPVIVFKLKTAINVDELYHIQHFNFIRKSTRQGRAHVDTIGCTIRGLRNPNRMHNNANGPSEQQVDDGTRKIKIEGCEYRIPKATLFEFLSYFGEINSDIVEVLFYDGVAHSDESSTNRTGTYMVKIRLSKDIPQLLPILGKRIKIYFPGIQRLCSNCFGQHPKSACKSKRVVWTD